MILIRSLAAALLLLTASMDPTPAGAQGSCVSGRNGRPAVESGRIAPFPAAAKRAGISPRDVQGVELCQAGGRYVYRVTVVKSGGPPRVITIPAN